MITVPHNHTGIGPDIACASDPTAPLLWSMVFIILTGFIISYYPDWVEWVQEKLEDIKGGTSDDHV